MDKEIQCFWDLNSNKLASDKILKIRIMETIKVHIDWEDNYGAASNAIMGCVATHKTLGGVKKNMHLPWNFI